MVMMAQRAAPPATPPGGAHTTTAPRRPGLRQARQFTLPSRPAAVAQGRRAVRETLRTWKLDAIADTAELLASELLTNAVQATRAAAAAPGGEHLALSLQRTGPGILVEVWDPSPHPAIPQDPGLTGECGRGLLLVEALASTWGQRTAGSGKAIWCEITFPAADGQSQDQDLAILPRPA